MDAKEMGKFIASRRKELHMTQAELGAKVGVTDKAISRWERGVGFPDLGLFDVLAEALGITSAELFAAKKDEKQDALACEEVAENALEIFRGKNLEMKAYSVIALILSVVTCCVGIAIVCYYVDSIKMRALLVGLLTLTGIFVSATNGAVFRATRR